jgi:hypothetical protein
MSIAIDPITNVIIMDRSGSMETMGDEPLQAINEYLKTQRVSCQENDKVSLYTFNNECKQEWFLLPVLDAPKLLESFNPSGTTALNDAVLEAINDHEDIKDVVIVIITDGMENASSIDYNGKMMIAKISEMKRKGWKFVYLAANQNSFTVSRSMGVESYGSYDQSIEGDLISLCRQTSRAVSECRGDVLIDIERLNSSSGETKVLYPRLTRSNAIVTGFL